MRNLVVFSVLVGLLAAGSAIAEPKSEVKGSIEINGTSVPVKYVYALQHNDEENFLDGPELRILFADREVDPSLLTPLVLSGLDTLAREKKIRGMILKFDPKKEPREIHGTLLDAPAKPEASLAFFTQAGDTTCFTKLEIKDNVVTGALEEKPSEDTSDPDIPKYGFKIEFSTPVRPNDAITARLKGAEAVKSPQAQAVLAYEKACREGRFEDAAKLSTPAHMADLNNALKQMGKETFLQQVKQFIPETAVREKQIEELIARGKHAVVIIRDNGLIPATVVEENGVWKAD